ncbi:hypothetical protein [Aminipila terrae]|uniref:Uncharacterized protein n=1 Tax=Aminipila terrae TaxID=2697030 RepID=A0A6P1ML82_9FIRM|nr:hypothetical protein [Aminipila terrae]QHI72406.1 hypothetical protein Ami3637_08345 [Aminipila terrae]
MEFNNRTLTKFGKTECSSQKRTAFFNATTSLFLNIPKKRKIFIFDLGKGCNSKGYLLGMILDYR